ncbi:MAG: conjugal transfer protein TrbE, partial [Alphaproteobacteria bacterium]|nr:conjugal transfer protein TrbE [Alphaproteobacteria bacterium]
MFHLAEYRNNNTRLADFLPWAALCEDGVVLNKDGSFQRTACFRGPDLDSAVPVELVAVAGRLNNALRRLGSGWAVFFEAQRRSASSYPESKFPDVACALVDAERKAQFEEEGVHFDSAYFLTFLYLPPAEESTRGESLLYDGITKDREINSREALQGFIDRTNRVLQLIDGFMRECAWLDSAQTLSFLHSAISTYTHNVRVPEIPIYLDVLLADQPLTAGLAPMLGRSHLRILTIIGFPTVTTPGLLDELNSLAFAYRWSTRAIMLDKTDATKVLTKIRRHWFAKRKSVAAILKEVMTNEASTLIDADAQNKAMDADAALQEL